MVLGLAFDFIEKKIEKKRKINMMEVLLFDYHY